MAFSKFFGRGRDAAPPEPRATEAPVAEDEPDAEPEATDLDEALPEDASRRSWRERAEALIPSGASTGSKRAVALWGDDADPRLPTHLLSARGCRIIDVEGTSYVDCTMALGSVALGYAEPRVTRRQVAELHAALAVEELPGFVGLRRPVSLRPMRYGHV